MRGRNAIGVLFGTGDSNSQMTVKGDTVISAGYAARMISDTGSTVYPEINFSISNIIDSENGDIANIGLWNENGKNVFDGNLNISLLADNESETMNFGIVSKGGTVEVNDGLVVNAYMGADDSSDLMNYDSDQLRAIQLLDGGSLTVTSRERASVIRSNVFIRGARNTLNLDFDREGALFEGNLIADDPNGNGTDTGRDNQTTLLFKDGGTWRLDRDNSVTALKVEADGLVEFKELDPALDSFRTLEIGTLSGADAVTSRTGSLGRFVLSIDTSAPNLSDKLLIDTHTGSHIVDFNVIGGDSDAATAAGTVFAEVGDEQGEFLGAETEGKLFWNTYDVASREEDGKTLWFINTVEQSSEETATTNALNAVAASNYLLWRQENELLRDRLGELRDHGTSQKPEGLWVRVGYGETGRKGSSGFDADYTRFQFGFDHRLPTDRHAVVGVALDYRTGDVDFNSGSSDNESYGLSAYFTTYGENGVYTDAVLRYAHLSDDVVAHDSNGQRIGFDAENDAISASLEIGHRFLVDKAYFEPHVKVIAGRIFSNTEHLSNGVTVDYNDVSSVIGRIGLTAGVRISPDWQVAAKASVLKEFCGEYRAVASTSDETRSLSEEYDDTWYVFGLDTSYAVNDSTYVYGTAQYETGDGLKDTFAVTGGLRWMF